MQKSLWALNRDLLTAEHHTIRDARAATVDALNADYPVGTKVLYWDKRGQECKGMILRSGAMLFETGHYNFLVLDSTTLNSVCVPIQEIFLP